MECGYRTRDPSDEEPKACEEVRSFPAFCHVETGECRYGLRTTREAFEELLVDAPPSSRLSEKAGGGEDGGGGGEA